MIPRAVKMAKAVTDSELDTGRYGNILAAFPNGWTNRSANYYTQSVNPAWWDPGTPFMAQPTIYGFTSAGQPIYRWFPQRPSVFWDFNTVPVRAIVPGPLSSAPVPPPIGDLSVYDV